jgi:transposase
VAYIRKIKTLDKNIAKEYTAQSKAWWHLSHEVFGCHDDLKAQAQQTALKYHKVEYQIVLVKKHTTNGRPKEGVEPATVGYKLEYTLVREESRIPAVRSRRGRFILATNHLDSEHISEAELLKEYKNPSGVEHGFKFIKDDTFQVDSVFLKIPSRIAALLMIMSLCLMVYGSMEYHLHQELVKTGDTIPNAVKKPTNKPSLKWVFLLFRVVNEVQVASHGKVYKVVANLNVVLRKIIDHFGSVARAIYLDTT